MQDFVFSFDRVASALMWEWKKEYGKNPIATFYSSGLYLFIFPFLNLSVKNSLP